MKTYNNPEFHIFYKLQLLRERYPDLPELEELEKEVRKIINTNSLDILRWAMVQAIPGQSGDLTPETIQKMKIALSAAQTMLDVDYDAFPEEYSPAEESE